MSLSFLPGRPNDTQQSTCQARWHEQTIFSYCSGNNVIVFSNEFSRLQTIYLESDSAAVDINPENGFIAIAVSDYVSIYKPIHEIMKKPKWIFCCKIFHDDSAVNSLSWGSSNEIIVGSNYLSFWKLLYEFGVFKPVLLWNKRQPKPVYLCKISEDSELIASMGKYDHMIKLWKRISISDEQDIFNLTLLPHPAPVSSFRWKKTDPASQKDSGDVSQVIYTLCQDNRLRIWSCYELNTIRTVQQWGCLELKKNQKYCLIIDNWILQNSIPKESTGPKLSKDRPDLVLFGSPDGKFDVYLLMGLSNNPQKPMTKKQLCSKQVSTPAYVQDPNYLYFSEVQPYDTLENIVSVVVHDLRGVVRQSRFNVQNLIEDEETVVGLLENKFTGHNKSVQKLIRSSDGEAMLTISRFSENCVWCPKFQDKVSLHLKNIIHTEVPISLAIVHEKGNLVICLLENGKIQAWECPREEMEKESYLKAEYQLPSTPELGDPILMLNTPEPIHNHERHFIALIFKTGNIKAFEVSFAHGVTEVTSEKLDISEDEIYHLSVIDPVHRSFSSNRPLISIISKKGITSVYKAIVDFRKKHIKWIKSKELNTGLDDIRQARGSSTGKLCIVHSSGKKMTIWDMMRGVLEYAESFDDTICDIDWTSTTFEQSIVSIGFKGYAILYTQLRYDYTNNSPSYLPVEKIDITSHTDHDIGDSIWLKDGTFVVASGNQFYIKDKFLDLNDPFTSRSIGSRKILSNDILHLCSVLNGPLPVYHPQFLIQAIYVGKLQLVKELLMRLFLQLRNFNFRSEDLLNLDSNLGIETYKFFIHNEKDYPKHTFPDPYPEYNKNISSLLAEQLTKVSLPYVTRHQQITLITVIEAVDKIMKNESVVDYNGVRFLLGVKLFLSHKNVQKDLSMRDVTWALHSDNKELLLSMFDSHIMSWERAREYKISFWTKEADLIQKFEQIAKYEFSRDETRDPNRCAIFYLALKKKQILIGLWRMSTGHPEKQKFLKFLSNDFSEKRWQSAALKNAFVLLSKHRFMEAACFFLLAGSLKDSANVLLKQVKDIDLAIAVCRVYEGDNGPVLGCILLRNTLPEAIKNNDRWLTSFIYWKVGKQNISIKALVTAPVALENNRTLVNEESCVNRSFLVEDPALLVLYNHLRKRNVKYYLGSLEIENNIEYKLVLRVTDILKRMGCDYLALSLAKNWDFAEKRSQYTDTLLSSPKNVDTHSKINSMTNEPTTTEIVRPSLFDKFADGTHSKKSFPFAMSSKNTVNNKRSLLDDFATPGNSTKPRSLLDDFTTPGISTKPKSLLDDFTSSGNAGKPKSLLDDYTSSGKADSSIISQHRGNRKDEKENNIMHNSGIDAVSTVNKKTPEKISAAPRNLLDDFM